MGTDWYEQAETYDRAFAYAPEREIDLLAAILSAHGAAPPDWIFEPMAGTGRLLQPLAERGFRVAGLDRSQSMLLRARKRGLRLLIRGDASRFALERRFRGAFCLIDSFRYLLTDDAARGFFDSVGACLIEGSPLAIELELAGKGPVPDETWTLTQGGSRVRATIRSRGHAGPMLQWMESRVEIEDEAGRRVLDSRRPQRIWTPPAFLELLNGLSGYEVFGIYRRGQSLENPLEGLPRNGGPIIVVLTRTGP